MKHPWIEQIESVLRAHWWRGVTGILVFILLLQMYSWASTLIDFNHINNLILQAENLDTKSGEENQPPNGQENQPKQPAKNIFKKEDTNYQLTAILMDYAVINGQNVKVGEKTGKAEVKEIGNDYVMIQEEGKEQTTTLSLFQGGGGDGGRNESSKPSGSSRNRPNQSESQPQQRNNVSSAPPPGAMPRRADAVPIPMDAMGMGIKIEAINLSPDQLRTMQNGGSVRIESR